MTSPQRPFVLVTGASGFLGSHVVLQLLEAGYRVRCTARSLKARFLEEAHRARGAQFQVVEVEDIAIADLTTVLKGIEAVIHVAFPAPGSMESTDLLLNAVNSTTNLMRQTYELGIRKFVLTSSYLAIVGAQSRNVWRDYTFTDRDWSTATYDDVFNGTQDPAWVYAAAKKLAEAAAWDFARSRAIDLACVIPTLLIGPFAPGHHILSTGDLSTNVLLHSLLVSPIPPHPVWPHFVDVRDAATALIQALEMPPLASPSSPHPPPPPPPAGTSTPTTVEFLIATPSPSFTDPSFRPATPSPAVASLSAPSAGPSQPPPLPPPPSAATASHLSAPPPLPPPPPSVRPQKRFIASGASFTWPEAIAHLRAARPDLTMTLPNEAACAALPERVAGLDIRWTGAGAGTSGRDGSDGGDGNSLRGLRIHWRDWRETLEDAVRDLEKTTHGLERSGWEDLFGEDEEEEWEGNWDGHEPDGVP